MDFTRIDSVLDRVKYPGFTFITGMVGPNVYLQVSCSSGLHSYNGQPFAWRGRKWLLSHHMTDGEIVQTAFKAVLTALEHEAREQFTYRGVTIFDPHYDIEKLVELRMDADSIQEREEVAA